MALSSGKRKLVVQLKGFGLVVIMSMEQIPRSLEFCILWKVCTNRDILF